IRRFSSASTATALKKIPSRSEGRLYPRLSALGNRRGTVASTLNAYVREGNRVLKHDLDFCIHQLRRYKRYHHALEIVEWMRFRKFNFKLRDHAVNLELIGRVKGIAEAEDYFNALPPSDKVPCTYGALFNCYCIEKLIHKSQSLFTKMVQEKMMLTASPWNCLMSMYLRLDMPDKAIILRKQMQEMNVRPDSFTFNLLMNAFSSSNDIEGVERVYEETKLLNGGKLCNWMTYSNLAVAYISGNQQGKAKLALKKLEETLQMDRRYDREAFHFLISLYARLSDVENVVRVWELLKSSSRVVTNKSYLIMLQALRNLDDLKGMQQCFEEWESICTSYDIRLVNTMVATYLKHDMLDRARALLPRVLHGSKGPFFNTWDMFMLFFIEHGDADLAISMMDVASPKVKGGDWNPEPEAFERFLTDRDKILDINLVKELYESVKKMASKDSPAYKYLLHVY
ncbi:hypothetical protein M569_02523, partial [Genlisea aurea]